MRIHYTNISNVSIYLKISIIKSLKNIQPLILDFKVIWEYEYEIVMLIVRKYDAFQKISPNENLKIFQSKQFYSGHPKAEKFSSIL